MVLIQCVFRAERGWAREIGKREVGVKKGNPMGGDSIGSNGLERVRLRKDGFLAFLGTPCRAPSIEI